MQTAAGDISEKEQITLWEVQVAMTAELGQPVGRPGSCGGEERLEAEGAGEPFSLQPKAQRLAEVSALVANKLKLPKLPGLSSLLQKARLSN